MYREILARFDECSLPDLDVAVLGALELFQDVAVPELPSAELGTPLILGSGNAAEVGKILFEDRDAYYADESTYEIELAKHRKKITSAVIISASGGKDADGIAKKLAEEKIPAWLLTNTPESPAAAYVDPSRLRIFPKNREPYTYNVSTYLGMLLAKTKEDPRAMRASMDASVVEAIPEMLEQYDAFYFILPPQFILMKDMFLTKFDEIFGAKVSARVFTPAQTKHAKTVVSSDTECFISFGKENTLFGKEKNRFHIPLPENADYAALMAIGYFVIGRIQKQHSPYFKDNIAAYARQASELFGETISIIVE